MKWLDEAKDTGNLDLILVDYVQIIGSIDARWKNKADLIKGYNSFKANCNKI